MKRINQIKQKMKAGQAVFGLFVEFPLPCVVEMIGIAGFDFVILDAEHGNLTLDTMDPMIPACDVHGLTPIVRVADLTRRTLLGAMELGAGGVLVPQIFGPDEVREVVAQTKYRPIGRRGLAFTTRSRSYCDPRYEGDYFADANEQALIAVQIETAEALEKVEAICAVPGLDLVFVGPYDLSDALGLTGQIEHPQVVGAIERIGEAARRAGVLGGIYAPTPALAERWVRRGFQFIGCSTDMNCFSTAIEALRRSIGHLG